jgi:Fic family protein
MVDDELPWRRVAAPEAVNGDLKQVLASVDSLQRAWADVVDQSSAAEFEAARLRSLRRHAIETGIIERLYDVEWGVTEALIAEGLSAEVAAREGGIGENALETIRAQFDALTYLSEAAKDDRALNTLFIRDLHRLICRTQETFEAKDQFGRLVVRPLQHGAWKELPDLARRSDGTVVQFVPPEHVQSEIERMLAFDADATAIHPVVRAAWLHHAFVSIHPFDDGNGRVARALSLLGLLKSRYAPLVVDRFSRSDYIAALDSANDGDLRDLVRLFARLEVVALRAELERPTLPIAATSGAVNVARALVDRLREARAQDGADRSRLVESFALELNSRVEAHLGKLGQSLRDQFAELDPATYSVVYRADPPEDRASWWRAQIIRAARQGGFFTNLARGAWWSYLRIDVLSQQFRYVVVTQKVGRGETGVLALTVFAESVPTVQQDESDPHPQYVTLLAPAEAESATFVSTDTAEARWDEVTSVIDRTLTAAIANFAAGLA